MSNRTQFDFDRDVKQRKSILTDRLRTPLANLANKSNHLYQNKFALNQALSEAVIDFNGKGIKCNLIYLIDKNRTLISHFHGLNYSTISAESTSLAFRPYLTKLPKKFKLSKVYVSEENNRSSISAIHPVVKDNKILAYLIADFKLSDISGDGQEISSRNIWMQLKGDPSIRSTLFMQTKTFSEMDENLDEAMEIIAELIIEKGIFHGKLHLSSSRVTIWLYSDPYRYRVHPINELLNISYLAYPNKPYPKEAIISKNEVRQCLALFKQLRQADEIIYLRSASINIINGFVGLNFSCDGSHYIPVKEFLRQDASFWFES